MTLSTIMQTYTNVYNFHIDGFIVPMHMHTRGHGHAYPGTWHCMPGDMAVRFVTPMNRILDPAFLWPSSHVMNRRAATKNDDDTLL